MTSPAPRTPAEWLLFLADLGDRHPLVAITSQGSDFQRSCTALILDAGMNDADLLDLQADLLTILPRLINATVQAQHNGAACPSCSRKVAAMLYGEIMRDATELAARQKTGGLH